MADIYRRPGGPYPAPLMDGSHRDVPRGTPIPSDKAIEQTLTDAIQWAHTHRDQHLFDQGPRHIDNLITLVTLLRNALEKTHQLIHINGNIDEMIEAKLKDHADYLREIARGLELFAPDPELEEAIEKTRAYADKGPSVSQTNVRRVVESLVNLQDTRRGLIDQLTHLADRLEGTAVR